MKADDDHPAPERTLVDDDNDVPEHVAIDIPIADSVASVDVSTERRVDETRVLWQEQERQRKAVHTAKAEFVRSSQEAQQGKSFFRYDDELLHRAVADAGRWAYGTIFVELWALNDERTLLFRPEAGWWVDPVYHRDCGTDCPICRLTDSDRPDYVRPGPLTPGEGLPGALWAETGHHAKQQQRSWLGSHSSNHVRSRFRSAADVATHVFADTSAPTAAKKIVWREIKAMANDPDQPWNLRLQLLATMGLGWVAAVDFDMHRHCGIVLFMTRENVDWHRLQSDSNETYLKAASDLAAAAYALRSPRRKVVDERRHELADVLRRVKTKILALQRMGVNLEQLVRDNAAAAENANPPPAPDRLGSDQRCRAHVRTLGHHLRTTLRKTRGGGAQPPPAMDWRQTLLTFIGCFVTLLMITRLNVYLLQERGPNDAMALGPFGALMTLLYGLTAAPASQPRNVILGQIVALTIAVAIGYAHEYLNLWVRQSLTTALAVAAMVKLGVTHPPAGAAALIFASGPYGWGNLLFLLVGNVIAVGAATLINNWSDMRQYPIYWGVPYVEKMVAGLQVAEAKKAV